MNLEGRVQLAGRAAFPPGDAREDWAIIRALSGALGQPLAFNSFAQLRSALLKAVPHMANAGCIAKGESSDVSKLSAVGGNMSGAGFAQAFSDFYLTNPIARASAVMAECSALATQRRAEAAE